jgi:hypothetical protein
MRLRFLLPAGFPSHPFLSCGPTELIDLPEDRSLCTSIIGQQVSWLAARAINHKFRRLFDPGLPEKAGAGVGGDEGGLDGYVVLSLDHDFDFDLDLDLDRVCEMCTLGPHSRALGIHVESTTKRSTLTRIFLSHILNPALSP